LLAANPGEAAKPLARNYELRRVLTPEEQKAAAAASALTPVAK
jgi:hypothetical protein